MDTKKDKALRGISLPEKTNPDLQKERDGASFDPIELTFILDQGLVNTYRRRFIGECVHV